LCFFSKETIYKKIIRKNFNNERAVLNAINQAGTKSIFELNFKKSNYVLTDLNLFGQDVYYGKSKNSDKQNK